MSDSLTLERNVFTDNSTTGEIRFDGVFQCYSLEPTCRKESASKYKAIPAGRYELLMQWSTRFQMDTPHLQNVPDRTFIEIHPGNFENEQKQDSEGCILLGQSKDVDYVGESRAAYQELVKLIEQQLQNGRFYINIMGCA